MRKLFGIFIVMLSFLAIWSCNPEKKEVVIEEEIIINESSEFLINATLWVQQSAEYEACCYQAFNYAKLALDTRINLANMDKPLAVVFDVDETLLDNSYYEANLIENNTTYTSETWKEWSDMQCATAIPGAIDLLNYVQSKGVEIIYISNRRENELEASISNMEKIGFPAVPVENFYFRTDESSKVARREMVSEKYNIVLLVGDNLADFDGMFEDRSENMGKDVVTNNKDNFGTEFIILPNPMYGKWERALPSDEEKTATENRINAVIGYDEICK
ncbi:MAG: 5'-nucleotidase, lipoprotein e(P4) family [Marinilabiliales bacterium]|nr:MAG: 5'-nucleotidase, lipoprotein e(P4) family [Marinilabiliales bacterium]